MTVIPNIHLVKIMVDRLAASKDRYEPLMREMIEIAPELFASVAETASDESPVARWQQSFFTWLDALSLCAVLRQRNPLNYVEIGSGNSTRFARWCIDHYGLRTRIACIDPSPRLMVSNIADEVQAKPVQDVPLDFFDCLIDNDVIFYDGSHEMSMKTDMCRFCYEIVPSLDKNVMIGLHDTYLPLITQMAEDHFAAALLMGGDRYAPDLPAHYLSCVESEGRARLLPLLEMPQAAAAKRALSERFAIHRQNISGDMNGATFFFSKQK